MSLQAIKVGMELGGTQVLADVSLQITGGEIVSLIGANGAGKTSLLKVLCGESMPTSGQMLIDDVSSEQLDLEEKAKKVAVLPQRSGLDFPFVAYEVIHMGRYPQMTSREFDAQVVKQVEQELALGELSGRIYTTLSGGEKQRVQIARILAQVWEKKSQAYFFFDEATAPLDLAHQLEFFALMKFLADQGAAIVLVLHDINFAARFSDRIVLLKRGQIIADDCPAKVITEANIKSGFDVAVKVNVSGNTENKPTVQISY